MDMNKILAYVKNMEESLEGLRQLIEKRSPEEGAVYVDQEREFAEAAAQKQRKEAANGTGSIGKKFTDKAEDLAGRLAEWIRESVAEHPLFLVSIAAIMIVVLIVSGSLTSCSALGSLINNTTLRRQQPSEKS